MFIFIALLVAVLIWMAVTYRTRMRVRGCIWRENRTKDDLRGRYFLCVNCGAERWETGGPPKLCHRPAEPG